VSRMVLARAAAPMRRSGEILVGLWALTLAVGLDGLRQSHLHLYDSPYHGLGTLVAVARP
jgi:hypothetical protein